MESLSLSSDSFNFGDERLNTRLGLLSVQLLGSIEGSTPSIIGDSYQTKAYYRFINNDKVTPESLVSGYGHCSVNHSCKERIILAVQDSTTLHYSTKRAAPNLDCLERENQKGFVLHNHFLMNELGLPLGLFSQSFYARKAEDLGRTKVNLHKKLPIESKESYRWLQEFEALQEAYSAKTDVQVIQICDREADIHEVLQARKVAHVHYIIRSAYPRKSPDNALNIWEQVADEPFCHRYELKIPQSAKRTARTATMEVRYKKVMLRPSYRKAKNLQEQEVWLVETKEVGSVPQGEAPIHWRLLSSIPIEGVDKAIKIIEYYVLRWTIERFHYVLKQGVKVENLQITMPAALKNAIILKSWQAIEVMILQYMPTTNPNLTVQQAGWEISDYHIALVYAQKNCNSKEMKKEIPLIGDFMRLIAQIGGHSLQKSKPIGVVSIWKGWDKFNIIKKTYQAMKLENI